MQTRNKYAFNKYDALVLLFCLFNFTTTIQSTIDNFSINKIVGAFIAVIIFKIYIEEKSVNVILTIYTLILLFGISIYHASNYSMVINDFLYWVITIFLLEFLQKEKNIKLFYRALLKNKRFLYITVVIVNLILCFLLITKTGFQMAWGQDYYFVGLTNTPHTMASSCCLTLALVVVYNKLFGKSYILSALSLVSLWSLFQSGSRVFLFAAAILCVFIINTLIKRKMIRILIYGLVGIAFALVLVRSSMLDKFMFTLRDTNEPNALGVFTSGRAVFWQVDINALKNYSIFELIFGKSFDYVYGLNFRNTGMFIWPHDDFIHVILGTGLVGLLLYCSKLFNLFKYSSKYLKNKFVWILCISYIMVAGILNGFFTYQHYVYSTILLFVNFYQSKYKRHVLLSRTLMRECNANKRKTNKITRYYYGGKTF